MGAKGSRQALESRFRASDFRVAQTAQLGVRGRPSALATWEGSAGALPRNEERLLAVGCDDGSVYVHGTAGVNVRLSEESAPDAPLDASSASTPAATPSAPRRRNVLFVSFLSSQLLVTVHPHAVKLWSLAAMGEIFSLHTNELPPLSGQAGSSSAQQEAPTYYEFTSAALSTEQPSRVWLGTMQGVVLLFDCTLQRLSQFTVPLLPEALGQPSGVAVNAAAVHATALAAVAAGLQPPTAVTALAQLPTDSSQLLIGYANDSVLTYHIATQKLHRAYRRAGVTLGGVTALSWQTTPGTLADQFVVGHRNGCMQVWWRKTPATPAASFFLSAAPGPRAPITKVRWSTRSAGFFVAGGHLLPSPSSSASPLPEQAVDQGCVVFVSGLQFEQRRILATSLAPADQHSAGEEALYGIADFAQVQMVAAPAGQSAPSLMATAAPGAAAAAAAPAPVAPKLTPAFICILASGALSVVCPTIVPPVPPLPISDFHDSHFEAVHMVAPAPGDAADAAALRDVLSMLRSPHQSQRCWTTHVRASLAAQGLWPLGGGVTSRAQALIERDEERLFAKMELVVSPGGAASPLTPEAAPDSQAADADAIPALLLTAHSAPFLCVRLYDASCSARVELLAQLPLNKLLPRSARVTAMTFVAARRELTLGTNTGEVFLFKLEQFKAPPPAAAAVVAAAAADTGSAASAAPAPSAGDAAAVGSPAVAAATPASPSRGATAAAPCAPATPAAPAPATPAPSSPAPQVEAQSAATAASSSAASPTASASAATPAATAATPTLAAAQYHFELVHRNSFSTHSISHLSFSQAAGKYFLAADDGTFALLRPDTGVALAQSIPHNGSVEVTAAHFSSEQLVATRGPSVNSAQQPLYLYVCESDGSVTVLDAVLEARVGTVPSLIPLEEGKAPETVRAMHTLSVGANDIVTQVLATRSQPNPTAGAAGSAAAVGGASASRQFVLVCTDHSLTLLSPIVPGDKTAKNVEVLGSVRLEHKVSQAALVTSPHCIARREENGGGGSNAASPPPASSSAPAAAAPAPPAPELCLVVVDERAVLSVYSVDLKCLSLTPLHLAPSALSSLSLSLTSDGRMALLPSRSSLHLASLFPPRFYGDTAPSARLLSDAAITAAPAAAAASTSVEPVAAASPVGWFSSFRGAVSHETLYAPPLYTDAQLLAHARATGRAPAASAEADRSRASAAEGAAACAHWDAQKAARQATAGGASSKSTADAVQNARTQVSTTQQTMAQNQQLAANNLRRTEEVADKSELMADHANDFLAAARALRKKQESSWW